MKQKIYLITHLYNIDDKIRTCKLEKFLKNKFDVDIYMPYRDSKEEQIEQSAWKQEIFRMDMEKINEADIILGYVDGVAFDEGIGFEIGYAAVKGKKIILLNSDFIEYVSDAHTNSAVDPLLGLLDITFLKISHELDFDNFCVDLDKKANELLKLIELEIETPKKIIDSKKEHEYFIELGNSRFFSSCFDSQAISTRLSSFNAEDDLEKVLSSKRIFVYANGMQMHFGSAVICGICYALNIPFYIVDDRVIYIMGGDLMKTNLMIDVSCSGYIDIMEFYEIYKIK